MPDRRDQPAPPSAPGPGRGFDAGRRSRETAGMPPVGGALPGETDLTGRTLGGFKVIRRLGRGAVGTVYLAEQTALRRPVALKVLSPERAGNDEYLERFAREAHAVARLVHPNAVQVYDIGEADGCHYLALEYVDGEPLGALLERRGKLPWRSALEVIRQAAGALARAHELNIVHRDIKPENLILSRRGEVKVADFGLARLSDDPSITHHGTILGTPFYMSPEQAMGQPAGPAADLYALGATLYHMLVGHPPFEAVTAVDVLRLHATVPPRPPAELDPAVPVSVSELVLKLMAKRPADRPESAKRAAELITEARRREEGATPAAPAAPSVPAAPAGAEAAVIREILGPEGRSYRRVPVDLVANARPTNLPRGARERLAVKVVNLSRGGLFLTCEKPLPAGSLMELSFRPAEGAELVEGLAAVRWVSDQPRGMGLEFVRLGAEERERLARTVARAESGQVLDALVRTELNRRMLRAYCADMAAEGALGELAERAGTSVPMVREGLSPFVRFSLARIAEDRVQFRPPPDAETAAQIRRYAQERGLA